MIRTSAILAASILAALALAASASAAEPPCTLEPRTACFGLESTEASLSTNQAGAHPDLTVAFKVAKDPESKPNSFGLQNAYAATSNVRIDLPPGLLGDPNAFGPAQQCSVTELLTFNDPEGGCPNASQIGLAEVAGYSLNKRLTLPLYMMQPPGGEVAARLGFVAGIFPTFVNFKLRSESDYGVEAVLSESSAAVRLVEAKTTVWGVPTASQHDTERCRPFEALFGTCTTNSPSRPPGGKELPFMTNPTSCGEALEVGIAASSWVEPDRLDQLPASLGQITGCDSLPFGPSLSFEPTSRRAASPTGANVRIKLPASEGVEVLEPSQMKDIRVELPEGFAFNPAAGDGLETCGNAQIHLRERLAAQCPDAAKLADTEFDIPVLERDLKGAVYLREPEPGSPFRIWIVADDLGLHVKLPGELEVDKATGQITSVTTGIPQAPVREARLLFKSGFRAPLITPERCGTYRTAYEFTPWSGGPSLKSTTSTTISEGCDTGGFDPKLSAGTVDPSAGEFSPFVFTLRRDDGEQNPASLDIALPRGLAASFRGIPRCGGAAAVSGDCPEASRVGHVIAAVGAGPAPLWVPQAGKRPTAVYLGGPYKGGPLSIVAVVPKQAGPFDFGDEVVRSAVYVDPVTAQATIKSDPLPQRIEGIPVGYRTLHVAADREGFTLNPTGCSARQVSAIVASDKGQLATPTSPFRASDCASLPFKPRLGLKLIGGAKRGDHPAFTATMRPRAGDANASSVVVRLPESAFLDQAHIRTICTRVQYAAGEGHGTQCPKGSIYGSVKAFTPLLDEPLQGPVFLRSSNHNLPDMVLSLHGLVDIEAVGRIDSAKGGIRSSFEAIPDAPLTKVVLSMQGGEKGLIVNSRNLCAKPSRAQVQFGAHNGRRAKLGPQIKAECGKKRRAKRG